MVVRDLHSMKRIIEHVNCVGWIHLLPNGYPLVQESGTRFGTHYQVPKIFLQAACHVSELVETRLNGSARTEYRSLKKTWKIDGAITGYTGIEALFNDFEILEDCIERFETCRRPTMHIALPSIY